MMKTERKADARGSPAKNKIVADRHPAFTEERTKTMRAIRRAWVEILPGTPFTPETSMVDAGMDSLAGLKLLCALEEAMGRKIAPERLSRETTAHQLARQLALESFRESNKRQRGNRLQLGKQAVARTDDAVERLKNLASDATVQIPRDSDAKIWARAVEKLLILDKIGTVDLVVPALAQTFPEYVYFSTIESVLRRIPPPSKIVFRDDPSLSSQLVERKGATRLLVAFAGDHGQLSLPINILDRWLSRLDAHVLYLRDDKRTLFLEGVEGLGRNAREAQDSIRQIAQRLGVSHLSCLGVSRGGYGAIRYGIDLGAKRVLAYSPGACFPSNPDAQAMRQLAAMGIPEWLAADGTLNLRPRLEGSASAPSLHIVYAAQNTRDAEQAQHFSGHPLVNLEALPSDQHYSLLLSVIEGRFAEQLDWLMSTSL